MKKLRTALCLAVIALCLPGIVVSARRLPLRTDDLIRKKYDGWSGVLRIRAFEGWTDAASGWIRRCAAAFEKSHPGVYIEIKTVEADRLLSSDGVLPPDMILFPPGLLTSASGLAPLDALPVRADLLGCGQGFAAPVALGGYGWAVNAAAEGTAVPADEPYRKWSQAAASGPDLTSETELTPPGVDLGLPASAADNSHSTSDDPDLTSEDSSGGSTPGLPAAKEPLAEGSVSRLHSTDGAYGIAPGLPETDSNASLAASATDPPLTRFLGGELGAVCVTQREIQRLNRLADQGRGPDWTLLPAARWTDQLLYLSALQSGSERELLSLEFIAHLLSPDCQRMLIHAGLFTALDAPTGYTSGSAMETMDACLLRPGLSAAPAFRIFPEP